MVDLFRADVLGELKTSNTVYYDEVSDQWSICVDCPDIKDDWFYCAKPDRYTGMNDCKGNPIYTNDFVTVVADGKESNYIVVFDISELDFKATNGKETYGNNFQYLTCCDFIEVIGNRHMNHEFLEQI